LNVNCKTAAQVLQFKKIEILKEFINCAITSSKAKQCTLLGDLNFLK